MKKVSMRFLFSFIAISAILVLFSCQGNGKKVNPPNNSNIPSTPGNHGSKIEKVILKFDSKKIIVRNVTAGIDMTEGSEVKVGTKLKFDTASDVLDKNKVFDGFRINKDKKSVDKNEVYLVDASHVARLEGKNVLEITFVEREKTKEKVKITFASNIKATKKTGQNNVSILSGEAVQDGEELAFVATVPEGKIVDSWFVNDVAKQTGNDRDKFTYIVNTSHAKEKNGSKEIEVKFTEKDVKKFTMQYEEDKFERFEYKDKNNNWKSLAQNEEVQTGLHIRFEIKQALIKQGKIVEYFTINGAKTDKVQRSSEECLYEVDDKDGKEQDGKCVIKIGVVMKEAKNAKLQFNEEAIIVKEKVGMGPGSEIEKHNGDEVSEGTGLLMYVKDENKKFQQVLCNGKYVNYDFTRSFCLVSNEYIKKQVNDYVLNITVKLVEKEKIKIKFDENIISCVNRYDESEKINSNTLVNERTKLLFKAKQRDDQIFQHWLIDDRKEKGSTEKDNTGKLIHVLVYRIDPNEVVNGEIEVKCILKDRLKCTLVLTDDSIEAMTSNFQNVKNNAEIFVEGDRFIFRIKHNSDKLIEKWFINGKDAEEYSNESMHIDITNQVLQFRLTEKFITTENGKNVLNIGCIFREPKEIKIEFDDTKLECSCSYAGKGWQLVNNGDKVKENNYVSFETKKGIFVGKWKINGKEMKFDSLRGEIAFKLNETHYVKNGDDFVMSVSIEEREALHIAVEFDPDKVECKKKDTQEVVQPGTKILEGSELAFKAKNVQGIDRIVWYLADREGYPEASHDPFFLMAIPANLEYREETKDYVIRVRWRKAN